MIGLTAAVYCCFQLSLCLAGPVYKSKHSSLSIRRKITVTVLYSTFTNVFLFLSRFVTFLTIFCIFGNVFIHLWYTLYRLLCCIFEVNVTLRLSLALNLIICSLGIFRIALFQLSPDHVITHVTSNDTSSVQYRVPNIVHYIWSVVH